MLLNLSSTVVASGFLSIGGHVEALSKATGETGEVHP
jgi:hypothetical protein